MRGLAALDWRRPADGVKRNADWPLRVRPALTLSLGALGIAVVAAVAPAYNPVVGVFRSDWLSIGLIVFLAAYLVSSALIALWSSAEGILAARPAVDAPTGVRHPTRRHRVAALTFALVILVETALHAGERSPSWTTSRPTREREELVADGYAAWVEGQPVHAEALYTWTQVEALSRRAPTIAQDFRQGIARTGHASYAFLVALVARVTSPFGSVYAAYLFVNALFWWIGALAVYDLARQATATWWVGLVAGLLTATGIGFTFAVGGLLSTPAAYGAVAVALWLIHRLRTFDSGASPMDVVFSACLIAGAALLYGLVAFYLAFFGLYFAGRAEWRRLLALSATVLAVGQGWSQLLDFTAAIGLGDGIGYLSAHGARLAALGGAAAVAVGLLWVPRWAGERLAALSVFVVLVAAVAAVTVTPAVLVGIGNAATATLQLPRYVGEFGQVSAKFGLAFISSVPQAIETLRLSFLAPHLAAAFPLTLCPLAVAGVPRLRLRWLDWCAALIVVAAFQTLGMNTASGAPHARLVFFCFPAMYLLAACGTANIYAFLYGLGTRALRLRASVARGLAVVAVAAALAPALLAANASLWGDTSFDVTFHFLNLT